MVTSSDQIVVQNLFLLDGYPYTPELDPITYQGYCSSGFDLILDPSEANKALDLTDYGTIKRIHMEARSGEISYKLNGSGESYLLNSVAILSQQPSSITFSNADAVASGIIEVFIIGETA